MNNLPLNKEVCYKCTRERCHKAGGSDLSRNEFSGYWEAWKRKKLINAEMCPKCPYLMEHAIHQTQPVPADSRGDNL